jgi:acyl carrier protein
MTELERDLFRKIVERLDIEDVDIDSLTSETALFGSGLDLDSIDALEIEAMIAEDYGIVILTSERTASTFGTIRNLAEFVTQHRDRDRRHR